MKKNIVFFIFVACHTCATQSFTHLFNQAIALHTYDPKTAITLLQHALTLNPNSLEAQYNMAYLLKNTGQAEQALVYYNAVINAEPNNAQAHIGKAQACLITGDYIQGFKDLEWRLGGPYTYTHELAQYVQQGGPLRGKKILLRAEWGIGDTIMFLRYAYLLHNAGAHIMIHLLHESLVPLLRQQPYLDEVIGPSQPAPAFHFQVPMVSLPIVFQTTVNTIPTHIPYISIDQQKISEWRQYFANTSDIKIGICWHGNTIHAAEKFMPLSYFAQLAQLPHIRLYSIQQHHGIDQLNTLEKPNLITTFKAPFDQVPFLDTAAVIKNLDLVITVDTSIAHLAGALGTPVWIILPQYADWRWLAKRTDSPWYPNARLFRQTTANDWKSVMQEISSSLRHMAIDKR